MGGWREGGREDGGEWESVGKVVQKWIILLARPRENGGDVSGGGVTRQSLPILLLLV